MLALTHKTNTVMLNLFQHPSCSTPGVGEAKWTLKQVQGDGLVVK
jgi:hypothetical protein